MTSMTALDVRIEQEVAALGDLPREELAARWMKIYGCPPPRGVKRGLLERAVAWHLQAKYLGGLSPMARKAIREAVKLSKAGKRYRYYISSRLKAGRSGQEGGWRIPAHQIEAIVLQQMKQLLSDEALLSDWMKAANHIARIERAMANAKKALDILDTTTSSSQDIRTIIHMATRRIDISPDHIRIAIDKGTVTNWLVAETLPSIGTAAINRIGKDHRRDGGADKMHASGSITSGDAGPYIIEMPLSIRKRGVERRLVMEGQRASPLHPDRLLIDMVIRAHVSLDMLTDGQGWTRMDVAQRFGVHPEDISRLLPLAFLSPRIADAILTGQQRADLSTRYLTRGIELPLGWSQQERLIGI